MDGLRVTGMAALIGVLTFASACTGSPFTDADQLRTPYERYQVLRGEQRPRTYVDSFGRDQPALRARLSPLGGS